MLPATVPAVPAVPALYLQELHFANDTTAAALVEGGTRGLLARGAAGPFRHAVEVRGRIGAVVTKRGKQAYRATLAKGKVHARASDTSCELLPRGLFPAQRWCRLAFKVWFDDDFPWGSDVKRAGGKLLGFRIGTGDAQGGKYSRTGASLRLTWARNGGVGPYLYPQVREPFSKAREGRNIGWDALDQPEEVRAAASVASGVHLFYPRGRHRDDPDAWELRFEKGKWNTVELLCELNTPGRRDGVLELSVNGRVKRLEGVRYRYDHAAIESIKFQPFFGGAGRDYAPPRTAHIWFADFEAHAA